MDKNEKGNEINQMIKMYDMIHIGHTHLHVKKLHKKDVKLK